jgi:6-phosphofructokinase 1
LTTIELRRGEQAVRIGILTAGGDAAGCNAAIRATALMALQDGHEVLGVLDGFSGLLEEGALRPLAPPDFEGALKSGGTMLGSVRTSELAQDHGIEHFAEGITANRLDALVTIGGNGTLHVADVLSAMGLPIVGIPKTVDFDVAVTDYCIGFDTAVSVIVDSLERMETTAASHHRVLVCEVMGRDTGWLAVMGGLAGDADMVLIPESPTSLEAIMARLEARLARGARSSVVVVAEGVTVDGVLDPSVPDAYDRSGHVELSRREIGEHLADAIAQASGLETRSTALGYIQRGGRPIASDRLWATRLGAAAYRAISQGRFASCTAVIDGAVELIAMHEVVATTRSVPLELLELFDALS